jgi:hypothetical protein
MSKENIARNKQIYLKWKNKKLTYRELSAMFSVDVKNVYDTVQRYAKRDGKKVGA